MSCGDENLFFSNEPDLLPQLIKQIFFFVENIDLSKSKFQQLVSGLLKCLVLSFLNYN